LRSRRKTWYTRPEDCGSSSNTSRIHQVSAWKGCIAVKQVCTGVLHTNTFDLAAPKWAAHYGTLCQAPRSLIMKTTPQGIAMHHQQQLPAQSLHQGTHTRPPVQTGRGAALRG
jgi:hypothetical protein